MALKGFPIQNIDPKWRTKRYVSNEHGLKADLKKFSEYFDMEKKDLHVLCKNKGLECKPIYSKGQFLEVIMKDMFKEILD